MSYFLMEELVGRHPDGIQEAVSLQVFINLWFGEGRIATEVVPILFVLVSLDDRVQNFLPTISAVNITRAQQDAFTIVQAEARVRPLKHGPPQRLDMAPRCPPSDHIPRQICLYRPSSRGHFEGSEPDRANNI